MPEHLPVYLNIKMQMAKLDGVRYAAKIGFPHQTVYAVMNGKILPSKKFLDAIGLETVYRRPGSPLLLGASDLHMYVVVKLQDSGLDPKEYAAKLGIHEQTLYTILSGIRAVPKPLIKLYGLETVYRIVNK